MLSHAQTLAANVLLLAHERLKQAQHDVETAALDLIEVLPFKRDDWVEYPNGIKVQIESIVYLQTVFGLPALQIEGAKIKLNGEPGQVLHKHGIVVESLDRLTDDLGAIRIISR